MAPGRASSGPEIDRSTPRALFASLLAGAVDATCIRPSPLATAYLISLLEARVRGPLATGEIALGPTRALLAARRDGGAARVDRLRRVGDHALFVAGFFRDSLERRVFGCADLARVGRSAYAELAADPRLRARSGARRQLFAELAERFGDYAEVLTEVGDRAALDAGRLLALVERYRHSGSAHARRRLLRRGCRLPEPGDDTWQ